MKKIIKLKDSSVNYKENLAFKSSKRIKFNSFLERMYLIRLKLVASITGALAAIIISLIIKFLMYAGELRVIIKKMP